MKQYFDRIILLILTITLLSACVDGAVETTPIPSTELVNVTPEPVSTNTPSPTNTPLPEPTIEPTVTTAPTETPMPSPTPVPQIAGIITDAVTGVGIANAFVEAIDVFSHELYYHTSTDEQGAYMFWGMEPAEYAVRVIAEGYAYEFFDNVVVSGEAERLLIEPNLTYSQINFDLNAGGAISGMVYADDGETAVSGAEVTIKPIGHELDWGIVTETAADGSYLVENLALGDYSVRVQHPEWIQKHYEDSNSLDHADPVIVEPPSVTSDIDFVLEKGGSISGFVYEADGVTPIAGALILAANTNEYGEWYEADTVTNADGSYTIDNLIPYSYKVSARKEGFGVQFYNNRYMHEMSDFVNVSAEEDTADINFIMQPAGQLIVRYFDEDSGGEIFNLVEVFISDAATQGVIDVAVNSSWLLPGSYLVHFGRTDLKYLTEWYEDADSPSSATPIEIVAGETVEIEMILTLAGSITGVVYEADGETPLAGASVFAFPMSENNFGAGAFTDENGRYTIEGLATGSYQVAASLTDYQTLYFGNVVEEASATLVIVNAPDQTSDIDIILTPE